MKFMFSIKKVKWHLALFILGIIALATHFLLYLGPKLVLWGIPLVQIPLLVAIVISAGPLLFQILYKLFHGDLGADVLAALSIVTAFLLQEYVACLLIILMLASGQALEMFAVEKASSVLLALAKRMPAQARRKVGQKIEMVFLSDLRIGDLVAVSPHETCPVDGTVVEGHGSMDESYLTGEPYRVSKVPGASVLSGAINGEAMLLVRADKLPKDSRYAQIIKVMEEAEQKRPKMRRLGDQLGAFFAPVSLLIAIGAWLYTHDSVRFLAVLVIATPCPLLIALPVTIISTISMAARRGIIIRDPTVLERLPTCKTAIFDKTGTLTFGEPVLTQVHLAEGFSKDEVLRAAASLEQYSKHPLAQAILSAAKEARLFLTEAKSVSEKPGQGLKGEVGDDSVWITSRKSIDPKLQRLLPEETAGLECVVLINQSYAATLQFRDAPRKDSLSFIEHLAPFHAFKKVMLVSGDRESEVAYLAAQLGIKETLSSQSPEQKVEIVRREAKKAPTLFMGDGINDAPAIRTATVGIAFGQPTSVTIEASGAVVMDNTMAKVDELLHLSKTMRQIALQSAVGGMALSFIGMGFAAAGLLSPVAGALLQQGIDALAILNALRMTWQKEVPIDLPMSPR